MNVYIELLKYDIIEVIKLQPRFKLHDKIKYIGFPIMKDRLLRDMYYTSDFLISVKGIELPIILEAKGYPREDYKMRVKLWRHIYGKEYHFWEVRSVKQLNNDMDYIVKEMKSENTK